MSTHPPAQAEAIDAMLRRLVRICDQTKRDALEALGADAPACCQDAAKAALCSLAAEFERDADECASAFPGSAATLRAAAAVARTRAQASPGAAGSTRPVPGEVSDGKNAHGTAEGTP